MIHLINLTLLSASSLSIYFLTPVWWQRLLGLSLFFFYLSFALNELLFQLKEGTPADD